MTTFQTTFHDSLKLGVAFAQTLSYNNSVVLDQNWISNLDKDKRLRYDKQVFSREQFAPSSVRRLVILFFFLS